jgi:transcriptional regulator with XRE-family HTH domain
METILFPTLKAEMARRGLTAVDVAEVIGISSKTAYKKLSGGSPFTLNETAKVRDRYFPAMTIEELFLSERKEA